MEEQISFKKPVNPRMPYLKKMKRSSRHIFFERYLLLTDYKYYNSICPVSSPVCMRPWKENFVAFILTKIPLTTCISALYISSTEYIAANHLLLNLPLYYYIRTICYEFW